MAAGEGFLAMMIFILGSQWEGFSFQAEEQSGQRHREHRARSDLRRDTEHWAGKRRWSRQWSSWLRLHSVRPRRECRRECGMWRKKFLDRKDRRAHLRAASRAGESSQWRR